MSSRSSNPTRRLVRSPQLAGADPDELSPSEHHVRGQTTVSDQFVRNVSKVGLVNPPICRQEAGELRIVDGVRRAQAAAQAGLTEISVLVCDLSDAEAIELSLSVNLGCWRTAVSDHDEESAMRFLLGGPRRPIRKWENNDDVFTAKYALGLVDDSARMMRAVGGADGVGEATALALAESFDSPDEVRAASVEELQTADGVGPKTAQNIREHLELFESGGVVEVWNVDNE